MIVSTALCYYGYYVGWSIFAGGIGGFIKPFVKKTEIKINNNKMDNFIIKILSSTCTGAVVVGLYAALLPISLYHTQIKNGNINVDYGFAQISF